MKSRGFKVNPKLKLVLTNIHNPVSDVVMTPPILNFHSMTQTDTITEWKNTTTTISTPLTISIYIILFSEMSRRWCTLEGGFLSFYDSERSAAAISRVDVTQVVSLAASNTETVTGAGYE